MCVANLRPGAVARTPSGDSIDTLRRIQGARCFSGISGSEDTGDVTSATVLNRWANYLDAPCMRHESDGLPFFQSPRSQMPDATYERMACMCAAAACAAQKERLRRCQGKGKDVMDECASSRHIGVWRLVAEDSRFVTWAARRPPITDVGNRSEHASSAMPRRLPNSPSGEATPPTCLPDGHPSEFTHAAATSAEPAEASWHSTG